MDNYQKDKLISMVLAPWIQKATALIGVHRKVGGNQFRHQMATMTILLDYKYIDPILLKASLIHDLLEDIPQTQMSELRRLDEDATRVVDLVKELTAPSGSNPKRKQQKKKIYFKQLREKGSRNAKVLKVADRISNLTDLNTAIFKDAKILEYIKETEEFILPMAKDVNKYMAMELEDLIKSRRDMINSYLIYHNLLKAFGREIPYSVYQLVRNSTKIFTLFSELNKQKKVVAKSSRI